MPLNMPREFKALILAGGYATRLYPITLNISKPLLKIGKKSIVDFAIDELDKIDFLKEIAVITNDKFYKDYLSWKSKLKTRKKITILNDKTKSEETKIGSIGDMYFAVKKLKSACDIVVIGGDNIFEKGLPEFIKFAQSKSPSISIGTYDIGSKKEAKRFGVVNSNKNNEVLEFEEKPEKPKSQDIAMCMYYFPHQTLSFFKEYVDELKLDTDKAGYYIKWLLTKIRVYSFNFKGKWFDIGHLDTYKEAEKYFE